jgi:Ca2+-binding RTX toxin-like protein
MGRFTLADSLVSGGVDMFGTFELFAQNDIYQPRAKSFLAGPGPALLESVVRGTGFRYDEEPGPTAAGLTAGQITAIDFDAPNQSFSSITARALDISARAFSDLLADNDAQGLMDLVTGGNDTINGSKYDDRMFGGAGDDVLRGGNGDDLLFGGAGRDKIEAGTALGRNRYDDTMTGGSGRDQFIFRAHSATNTGDFVADFRKGDTLRFDDAGFDGLERGKLDDRAFATSAFFIGPETRFFYDPVFGRLSFDADGSGTDAPMVLIVTMGGLPTLSASDLFVF